jgi:SynChlorMet cassette protein ScmD
MPRSNKPIANPVVVLREEFDDWAVLYNPDTANAVGVSPVGVSVWKLMDGKRSVEEIVGEIDKLYADVPDSAKEDVAGFVGDLADKGFVGYELTGDSP